MIPATLYHLFYIVLVAILSFIAFARYPSWVSTNKLLKVNNNVAVMDIILIIFLIFFIGYRDPNSIVFGDSVAYTFFFNRHIGDVFTWDWESKNLLFDNLFDYMSANFDSVSSFYVVIAFIYFGGIWYACRKMFPANSVAAIIIYLAAFSTFSYSTNGIRAGAAASLFLIALAINDSKEGALKYLSFIFLILSIGFHHSMRVPALAFIICKFIKSPIIFTAIWIFSFIISAFHITFFQDLFFGIGEELGDEKVMNYLSVESDLANDMDMSGFRLDFIIYSVVPIIVGWISVFSKKIKSSKYNFLLNLYMLINAVWMLCIYANFTNRIAYLSWSMYPIVLIYPFLRENWGEKKYIYFKYVAYGHLAFTLFMFFIYYG